MSLSKYKILVGANPDNLEKYLNELQNFEVFDANIYSDGTLVTVLKRNDSTVPGAYKVIVNVDPNNLEKELAKYSESYTLVDVDLTNQGKITAILQRGERGGGGGSTDGVFIGYVTNGDNFPRARPDGSGLVDMDYVRPNSESTFPFVIDGKTIKSRFDKAYYINGQWYVESGLIPDTSEVLVKDTVHESISKNAQTQSDINIENVTEFQKKRRTDKAQNEWWGNKYLANIYVKYMDGMLVTIYSTFMNKLNDILSNPDAEEEDKLVPYTFSTSCLVKSVDLTGDIALDAICYGLGKRVVVVKYMDTSSKERYKVYEIDLTQPIINKHVQNTPSNVWVVQHNLLKFPAIQVKSEDDDIVFPADIEYIDLLTVKITFSEPVKGYATFN